VSLLTRVLFRDWPLKLTAVGLAAVLYMGVAIGESTRAWTGPVPIEVLNAPSGGALLDDPGVVQRIEYRAPDDIADALTNDSFRASIDLSSVEPRAGAVTAEVPVDVFPVDPRVRVISYEPTGRTLRVDEVVSLSMPVTIDPGPLPQGIELGPVMVEPNQVVISGASSRVSNVRSVEGRFVVDASGINIDEDVDIEAYDDVGAIVPGVGIEPASVRVQADVARQLAYATLPVIPELTGEPQHGRRVDNVSVLPATVTVSGENPAVRQLDAIPTEPLDISGQAVELVAEVPLALPEEVTGAGVDTVSVIVTFTEALGSRAYETATALTGAQPELTYQVAEPSVRVVISGSVEQLDQVGPEQIDVEIPVAGLALGDNAVMPTVRSPRGTTVVSITPETVRVTVAEAP
jgi:YbbR domain-containing protein